MHLLLALLVGVLFAAGVYLILQRHLLRIIFGLILLGNAVNLLVFTVGRAARMAPPLIPEGMTVPPEATANPLPQALVLTAIVISFGLVAFALVLAYRAYATLGTTDTDVLENDAPSPADLVTNGRAPADEDAAEEFPSSPDPVPSDDLAR
jgi:multicomponent Na+:H+ antiporter subunit C